MKKPLSIPENRTKMDKDWLLQFSTLERISHDKYIYYMYPFIIKDKILRDFIICLGPKKSIILGENEFFFGYNTNHFQLFNLGS